MLATASFDVTAGETVTGSVTDGTNNLAGIAAVLRAKQLPSGSGKSNAAGAFSLHAEKGTYNTLSFGSDDWPQASCADVVIPQGGTTLAIQYNVARVAVGGSVVASDGTTPVPNARDTIMHRGRSAPSPASASAARRRWPRPGGCRAS